MALSQLLACGSCLSSKEGEDDKSQSQAQKTEPSPARADPRKTRIVSQRVWQGGEAGADGDAAP